MNRRNPEIFKALSEKVLDRVMAVAPKHKFKFKNPLYALDSTTIDLFLPRYDWAYYSKHKGVIKRETLAMLREADAIVTEELYASGWYHKTWQTFAIFVPVKTVGIRNGCRSYDYVIAIRSINSVDAVTAQVVRLPWELLEKMADRIVHEVDGVNRVVYDITAKPPGTIEWE